ncbi:hypothetical protein DFH09DRAFT_1472581 [Mycena vulgaris]|nr:hypothetical protein DFH09DRAFT_1472581 [Mycena vulgaris]
MEHLRKSQKRWDHRSTSRGSNSSEQGMPTLRSGVAQAVGLSLGFFRVDARDGREIQADVQRVHCFKSDRIYEKERDENGQEYPREKPATPDMQSGEDDEGPADSPRVCEGGGRSSRVEPAREDQDTTNSVRGILIESKRQPVFYRSAAQWERYPLLGNSACRTGFNGKLRTQWEICGLRTNTFEARVPIGVKFHSFEGGAVHVAVQLRAECENGTAWGCFWALLRSSVADFAVRRSFDVEEEGRGERGVQGDTVFNGEAKYSLFNAFGALYVQGFLVHDTHG